MSKLLLGNYSLTASENILYQLVFDIPENCEFTTASEGAINVITICLKEGELEASDKYVSNQLEFTMIDHQIVIEFEQDCGVSEMLRRPIIRIED